jgi:hypothetical protein
LGIVGQLLARAHLKCGRIVDEIKLSESQFEVDIRKNLDNVNKIQKLVDEIKNVIEKREIYDLN